MDREFKKNFWTCLMAVLLVVSNLIGMKLTTFMDITIGADFITFPWTFLCTLLILNMGGKRAAYRSILVASIIQLLITISYTIVVSLSNQTLMPDYSLYINEIFQVNQMNILASVLAFILSHCLLIYIYENFKQFNKELYGLVMGLLGAMFLNSIVYLVISLRNYETIFVINLLLSNVIIDIVMIVLVTIMFYILKEKETTVVINKLSSVETKDLSIEEVLASEKIVKKANVSNKSTNVKKKINSSKKTTTKKENTSSKTSTTSKAKVKKDNK